MSGIRSYELFVRRVYTRLPTCTPEGCMILFVNNKYMSDTTIIPVSVPRRMATVIDVRAKRLAMTRSEYIRSLVRREMVASTAEESDQKIERMLTAAARDLHNGKTKVLRPGGLAKMLGK